MTAKAPLERAADASGAEEARVAALAPWYLDGQLAFDKRMIGLRYRTIQPYLLGPCGLELGPAEGCMTALLLLNFEELVAVDAAAHLLAQITAHAKLTKVQALFEKYEPETRFDTIVMDHVLEHVAHPRALLRRCRRWLKPGGRIIAGVPNANSLHRLAAVKMGLLPRADALNSRDHAVGHRRVYDSVAFRAEFEAAGLQIVAAGGVFVKPLTNQQIEATWSDAMIEGFYRLGQDMPDLAAELFAVAQ